MIKIIITDDHPYIREGIKKILGNEKDLIIEDEAENGNEMLEKISKKYFDLVLLDISLPGKKGIDLIQDIFLIRPDIKILILTIHPEDLYAIRCLKSGAHGYITKQSSPDLLIQTIKSIAKGKKYITPLIAEKLIEQLSNKPKLVMHEKLSNREIEVFCLLAQGKSVSEIAVELFLSVQSISTYKSRIFAKMDFKNIKDLINYAGEYQISI